jgi:hypothetical protein
MNKFFVIVLLVCVVLSAGNAQEFRSTATAGFVFLEIPMTARSAALSEATVALTDVGASGLFINPAAIGFMSGTHSYSFSTAQWFADINHYGASYAIATDAGNFGISATVLDYGTMPLTVRIGGERSFAPIGTFSAQATAIGAVYSRALTDRFSFGVGFKYIDEKIYHYGASNIVFDGGIIYYTGFESLRLGASMVNFGTNAQFINDPFKMPTLLRIGFAGEVIGSMESDFRITAVAEALHPSDAPERLNAGVELCWNNMVSARGGYKFFYDEETFNFGIGLNGHQLVPVEVDFALSNYGRLGNILRLTISGTL